MCDVGRSKMAAAWATPDLVPSGEQAQIHTYAGSEFACQDYQALDE